MKIFSSQTLLNFHIRVSPKLVRGRAVLCPYRLYRMKQSGINQIIDLRNSAYLKSRMEQVFCRLFGIKYYNYRYPHRLNNLPEHDFFEKVNRTIIDNDGQTYIHCSHGKRRTGICVAIYEKEYMHKSKEDILSELYNIGFKELKDNKHTFKQKKLMSVFNDFIERYYPQSKGINNV